MLVLYLIKQLYFGVSLCIPAVNGRPIQLLYNMSALWLRKMLTTKVVFLSSLRFMCWFIDYVSCPSSGIPPRLCRKPLMDVRKHKIAKKKTKKEGTSPETMPFFDWFSYKFFLLRSNKSHLTWIPCLGRLFTIILPTKLTF
jgi:hypothetical protein